MTRARLAALGAGAALVTAAACQFDSTTVPRGLDRPIVHGVLNPLAVEQVILVERTHTGAIDVDDDVIFDPDDPLVTGTGIPISGALVTVTDEYGCTATAREDAAQRIDGKGAGVYRFRNGPDDSIGCPQPNYALPIGRGARYHLRIEVEGRVVTGSTTVPDAAPRRSSGVHAFDREHDTVRLAWPAVPLAKRYALRVESPYGPFYLFTDTLSLALPGTLRNFFALGLPNVFMPGFRQEVVLAAVDTNFFDYYRSANNPFTGSGLLNRLEGGTGVFGSLVIMDQRTLEVVAPVDEPVEGRFVRQGTARSGPAELRLFVAARDRGSVQLSGSYVDDVAGRQGTIGTLAGAEVSLALLRGQSAADTAGVLRGTFAGDSLVFFLSGSSVPTVYRRF